MNHSSPQCSGFASTVKRKNKARTRAASNAVCDSCQRVLTHKHLRHIHGCCDMVLAGWLDTVTNRGAALVALLSICCLAFSTTHAEPIPSVPGNWTLEWADDFDAPHMSPPNSEYVRLPPPTYTTSNNSASLMSTEAHERCIGEN
jgi:hypothetical protein